MKRVIVVAIMMIICILMVCFSLYSPELIGLSDNGDSARIMRPNRIAYGVEQREPFAFQSRFTIAYEGDTNAEKLYNLLFTLKEPYYTTHNLFIKSSLLLNLVSNFLTGSDLHQYNIFWLGIIYFAVALGAFTIIFYQVRIPNKREQIPSTTVFLSQAQNLIACLLITIMFCDVAYTAYFNSFYGEPVQFVALLWIVASMMGVIRSEKRKLIFVLLFFISVIIFSGAKFANIPQGVLLTICGLSFLLYFKKKRICQAMVLAFFILSLFFCTTFYLNVPSWMDNQTTYQSVFYGILKGSPTPKEDLTQLGLPKEFSALANTNAYMAGHKIDIKSEDFNKQFYDKVSKGDILKFYLTNPSRFIEKLRISCLNSAHIRPVYLGNYNSDHERLKFKEDVALWSNARLKLPLDSILFTTFLFLISGSIVLYEFVRMFRRKSYPNNILITMIFFTALLIINAMNLVIPIVANGEADLAKHMFAYTMGLDMQVLFLVFWGLWKLRGKKRGGSESRSRSRNTPRARIALLTSVILIGSAIAIIILVIIAKTISPTPVTGNQFNPGATVSFGSHIGQLEGNPITWRIIKSEGAHLQLFATEPVAYGSFDNDSPEGDANRKKFGSNFWPESRVREWLNKDFLATFSTGEQNLIQQNQHDYILSIADKEKAEIGDNEFFWTHVPSFVDFGAEDAFARSATDKLFLLDVSEFSEYVVKTGLENSPEESYWLETPYYNNSSMVRVVEKDGYVYMKDANYTKIGIRPSVIIDITGLPYEGDGSPDKPYVFN